MGNLALFGIAFMRNNVYSHTKNLVKPFIGRIWTNSRQLFGRCIEQSQAYMKAPLASEAHFEG